MPRHMAREMNDRINTEFWRILTVRIANYLIQFLVFAGSCNMTCLPQQGVGDRLASSNIAPKIVGGIPDFGTDYSWQEYKRVTTELNTLAKSIHDENWRSIVNCMADDRYCITVKSSTTTQAFNLTVGEYCKMLVRRTLVAGLLDSFDISNEEFIQRVGRYAVTKDFQARLRGFPEVDPPLKLNDWLDKRKDLSIKELQIEVCKNALEAFKKTESLTLDAKSELTRSLEKSIENIRSWKQHRRASWTIEDTFELFGADNK